jgi:hypothetical protein
MNRVDIPAMASQLNLLAEVFDKKPISEKAALVWFDTLKEFPTDKVCSILIAWPKTHGKFPTPAEVWKASNEITITNREEVSRRRVDEPVCAPEVAKRFMGEVRKFLAKPGLSPRQHWQRVLETKPKDSIGYRYAMEALKAKVGFPVEREPGQDDEERIAA